MFLPFWVTNFFWLLIFEYLESVKQHRVLVKNRGTVYRNSYSIGMRCDGCWRRGQRVLEAMTTYEKGSFRMNHSGW